MNIIFYRSAFLLHPLKLEVNLFPQLPFKAAIAAHVAPNAAINVARRFERTSAFALKKFGSLMKKGR